MKDAHVEIIKPMERIDPSLGGTGYQPPTRPATWTQILNELGRAKYEFGLPSCVFKVLRSSVSWKDHKPQRRLLIHGQRVSCRLIGGIKDWWFVSLKT